MGNALNMLMFNEADLGVHLKLLNQSLTAFEAAGYVERQGIVINNLGIAYRNLGLHRRGKRIDEHWETMILCVPRLVERAQTLLS